MDRAEPPHLVAPPRFVADRMLGKLARLLRMLGYDVLWVREGSREDVAAATQADRRLLTRDRTLARQVKDAHFVEHAYPFHQARQVLRAFGLDDARAFTRCVEDNGVLRSVESLQVASEVPAKVLAEDPPFFRCATCGKVYWPGSHVERMRATILALLDAPLPSDGHAAPDPETSALGRLEPLLDLHQAMDAMFWGHRVALLRGDLELALRELRRFAMSMARHIDLEEELVLPIYAASPPAEGYPRGGAPEIFRRDHEKILQTLTELDQRTEALLVPRETAASEVARLELLDAEKRYVDLLAHHDHRERAFLYPRLVESLSPEEQTDLLERMMGLASAATLGSRGLRVTTRASACTVPP